MSVIPLVPAPSWYGPAIALPLAYATPIALMVVLLASSGRSRVIGCLVIAAVMGVVIAGMRRRRREARIELWPDQLRLYQPALLGEPLRIPRREIRAITFDQGKPTAEHERIEGDARHRFAVLNDFVWGEEDFTQAPVGWLFRSGDDSILPLLGPPQRTPNTAIVVESPLTPVPRHRRLTRLNESSRFPGVSQPAHGFLAIVRRPADAMRALDEWATVRNLVNADVAHLLSVPEAAPADPASEETNPYGVVRPSRGARLGRRLTSGADDVGRFLVIAPLVAVAAVIAGLILTILMLVALTWWSYAWPVLGCIALYVAITGGQALVPPERTEVTAIGVPLAPSTHPRVIALVREAADVADAPMVHEVRMALTWDVAVRVIDRRRILFIGLPLTASFDQRTLTGIIAREILRHDLEPPLTPRPDGYHERLVRKLQVTHDDANRVDRWIARRAVGLVTQTIRLATWRPPGRQVARALAADARVAEAVGADALIDGLTRFGPLGSAFDLFMTRWYLPAFWAGYVPPLTDGLRRFLAQPQITRSVTEAVPRVIRDDASRESRHHLPLHLRVVALDAAWPTIGVATGLWTDEPTPDLFPDIDLIEAALTEDLYQGDDRPPRPMAWEDLVEKVWAPAWRKALEPFRMSLCWYVVEDLGLLAEDPLLIAMLLGAADTTVIPAQDARSGASMTLGCLLALALIEAGVRVSVEPGGDVTAAVGDQTLEVFEVTDALVNRTITASEWRRRCADMDIARVRLTAALPLRSDVPTRPPGPPGAGGEVRGAGTHESVSPG